MTTGMNRLQETIHRKTQKKCWITHCHAAAV